MRRGSRGVPGTMMKKVVAESRGESRTLMEEGGGYLGVYLLLQFVINLPFPQYKSGQNWRNPCKIGEENPPKNS